MARTGLGGTSSLLMALAVAVMGGFLFWLYNQAQSVESSVTPAMEDTAGSAQTAVTLSTLGNEPGSAVGKSAMLDSVEVGSSLGRGVFTLSVADTAEYPVLLAQDLIGRGMAIYGGDLVSVSGRFYTLNDSIRSEWVSRGAVDAASADSVPRVASFMLADSVDILR